MTAIIQVPLTKGYLATVDANDEQLIAGISWCASERRNKKSGEIQRVYAMGRFHGRIVLMHRLIMGEPAEDVDHRDPAATLNNQRCNLRISSRQQNNANSRKQIGTSSRYKGVYFHANRWAAYINVNGTRVHLGRFTSEEHAAIAYNNAATLAYGEFARPNQLITGDGIIAAGGGANYGTFCDVLRRALEEAA